MLCIAFEVSEESKEMLRHIEGPFGVISVAGMYRTGKSYLLNKVLLNRPKGQSGFGVGPSINPCTKVRYNPDEIFYRDSGFGEDPSLDTRLMDSQSTS